MVILFYFDDLFIFIVIFSSSNGDNYNSADKNNVTLTNDDIINDGVICTTHTPVTVVEAFGDIDEDNTTGRGDMEIRVDDEVEEDDGERFSSGSSSSTDDDDDGNVGGRNTTFMKSAHGENDKDAKNHGKISGIMTDTTTSPPPDVIMHHNHNNDIKRKGSRRNRRRRRSSANNAALSVQSDTIDEMDIVQITPVNSTEEETPMMNTLTDGSLTINVDNAINESSSSTIHNTESDINTANTTTNNTSSTNNNTTDTNNINTANMIIDKSDNDKSTSTTMTALQSQQVSIGPRFVSFIYIYFNFSLCRSSVSSHNSNLHLRCQLLNGSL